jgi:hypothetical protein
LKRREDRGGPGKMSGPVSTGTISPVADRSAIERELAEIGTQLAWVRDYL